MWIKLKLKDCSFALKCDWNGKLTFEGFSFWIQEFSSLSDSIFRVIICLHCQELVKMWRRINFFGINSHLLKNLPLTGPGFKMKNLYWTSQTPTKRYLNTPRSPEHESTSLWAALLSNETQPHYVRFVTVPSLTLWNCWMGRHCRGPWPILFWTPNLPKACCWTTSRKQASLSTWTLGHGTSPSTMTDATLSRCYSTALR